MIGKAGRWVDDRLGASRFARTALNKIFPDHWSFMLGEVALYAFVILVATGVFLAFFFEPSLDESVYRGEYEPLRGLTVSQAYKSTIELSFDVRFGLIMRQTHHWAANVFIAAIMCHAMRIFFTGAFRRPRELNWMIGVTLLLLSIFNGFIGYSLPDDLLSGTGLRIATAIALSVPVLGPWIVFLLVGGEFPAEAMQYRMYMGHILLVPALIATLLAAHLAIIWRQKHTQFPGKGRSEGNVVGSRLWPTYTAKSVGLFALVAGVLVIMGTAFQINPIWLYGPYEAGRITTAAQPDWYVGWLEGALRLFPPARIEMGDYAISEVFWPGVVLPLIAFGMLYAWPFLERRVTRDAKIHQLLDRPRDRPVRTAVGVAYLTFFAVLLLGGGQDIFAEWLGLPIKPVTRTLQIATLVAPLVTALIAYGWARQLAAATPLSKTREAGEPPVGPNEPEEEVTPEPARRWPRWRLVAGAGSAAGAALLGFIAGRRSFRAGR